jgi:uncharacterized protein (DUF697 family)
MTTTSTWAMTMPSNTDPDPDPDEVRDYARTSQEKQSSISLDDLLARYQRDAREALSPANIAVVGNAGVGKSTLINSLFRERVADVGVGRPVTDTIRRYDVPGLPICIWDTPGLELRESGERLIADIGRIADEGRAAGEPLHLCWFCFNGQGTRFQDEERRAIEGIARLLDVVLVATQVVDERDEEVYVPLVASVNASALPVVEHRVVATLAEPFRLGDTTVSPHGLDDLVDLTLRRLPESQRRAFVNALRATETSLIVKSAEARKTVLAAAAAAAAIGAVPIPFADAAVLVPLQLAMLGRIHSIMGLDLSKDEINELLADAIGAGAITLAGRWLVGQVAKFIPVAGEVISAGVAGTVTYGLGEADIHMCRLVLEARAEGRESSPCRRRRRSSSMSSFAT